MGGIVGVFDKGNINSVADAYYGLIALQHRGQQSAGIAINNDGIITCYKDMGLVSEVFDEKILNLLKGDMALGHVRYSTSGQSFAANAQPLMVKYKNGNLALSHDGNLINAYEIRDQMEDQGMIFSTSIDSEVIAALIAKYYKGDIVKAVQDAVKVIKGSYALAIMTKDKLIGVRDEFGMRPLVLGKLEKGYILASESCAIDTIGGELVRDVKPGEIIVIDDNGIESIQGDIKVPRKACIFEYLYLARPDSIIDNVGIYKAREKAGRILAVEQPAKADIVISVPDSGTPSGIGYANESGIPYSIGLIKNRYVGRSFIQPTQAMRELGVKLKLNPLKEYIKGKRVVMVDDSIVRGTTSKKIIQGLRDAGAAEVHVRVSSPPVINPCYFGIDTPSKKELVGAISYIEKIKDYIEADSLGYLSLEGLLESVGSEGEGFCTACFSGEYPMKVSDDAIRFMQLKR